MPLIEPLLKPLSPYSTVHCPLFVTAHLGRAAIPHVHGLTIGELAGFFNAGFVSAGNTSLADLVVVKSTGWTRNASWDDTDLSWVLPSPNLPTPSSALAYAATVFIEATTVAEGRGTTTPFTLFGAPFLSAPALAANLNAAFANGLSASTTAVSSISTSSAASTSPEAFRAAYFDPAFSKYNGTDCAGVGWVRNVAPLFSNAASVLVALRDLSPPGAFVWDGSWFGHPGSELIDQYAGTPRLRELIDAGASAGDLVAAFAPDASDFREARAPFLLYG